jgi:hypothetical protein
MGHQWSSPKGEYYVGNGTPYAVNHFNGLQLSHDRKTDVIVDGDEGYESVVIGSRAGLHLFETYAKKKRRQSDLIKRLGLVIRTSGSRITKTATVVVKDMLRVNGNKLVARNKTWGHLPQNWQGVKGPAESSGALRIGDSIYAINGVRTFNKSRGQVLRMLSEQCSRPIVITFQHTEIIAQVPWELEICMDPPEGEYREIVNEWGIAKSLKIDSVSI